MPELTRYERLTLRKPAPSDGQRLFEIFGDPATNRYNPFGPHQDLEKARSVLAEWIAHWDRHGFGQWAVSESSSPDAIIGFGGLTLKPYGEQMRLNLGYRFAPASWGRGLATEMGGASLDFAFGPLGRDRVDAVVRPTNLPSIRVLEKLGMRLEETLDDVPGEAHSLVYVAHRQSPLPGPDA